MQECPKTSSLPGGLLNQPILSHAKHDLAGASGAHEGVATGGGSSCHGENHQDHWGNHSENLERKWIPKDIKD
jgi:hypothetical protein